jgi:formylmethanofuran--tetrahydromethanopterin N-formyltransferase
VFERFISPVESPVGRPGASILAFAFTTVSLAEAVANRTGQCLLTCPTTAVFDGLSQSEERIPLGQRIRFFGDGFEKKKVFDGRRYWRVPVMDGEFLVEENCGVAKGVGGGNVVIQGISLEAALASAKRAVSAIAAVPGVITPFPGGVVRSGSKVGSRYAALKASTNTLGNAAIFFNQKFSIHYRHPPVPPFIKYFCFLKAVTKKTNTLPQGNSFFRL